MSEQHFNVDDELDLSGEGFQAQEVELLITDAKLEANDNGQRYVITFEPVEAIEDLPGNKVTDMGYLVHNEREDLVKYGRGGLKRLGKAALGTEVFKLPELIGRTVRGYLKEDDAGFVRVGRYKKAA